MLKLIFVLVVTLAIHASQPVPRLIIVLIFCSVLGLCLVSSWKPCAVPVFNSIRGVMLFAAAWTNVAALVAVSINDANSWVAVGVLVAGWFGIIPAIGLCLRRRHRNEVSVMFYPFHTCAACRSVKLS